MPHGSLLSWPCCSEGCSGNGCKDIPFLQIVCPLPFQKRPSRIRNDRHISEIAVHTEMDQYIELCIAYGESIQHSCREGTRGYPWFLRSPQIRKPMFLFRSPPRFLWKSW